MKDEAKLICDFMGYEFIAERKPGYRALIKIGKVSQGARFHESWEHLMPVVEKIESINHIGIDAIYLKIQKNTCQIWTYFDVKEFLRLTGDDKNDENKFRVGHTAKTKIEATYNAVVDFIKWYNGIGSR